MEEVHTLSTVLRNAETLGDAIERLLTQYPDLTIEALNAVERAERLDLGWGPGPAHRDALYLVVLAAILSPIASECGDLPLSEGFARLVEGGHLHSPEIASALAAARQAA